MKIISESTSKVLELDVNDVENTYSFDVRVDFVPYEGTIKKKYLESIRRKRDCSKIDMKTFGKELAESCGFNNCKSIDVKMTYYAYWNNDGDIEWHDTLSSGVQSIKLYIQI